MSSTPIGNASSRAAADNQAKAMMKIAKRQGEAAYAKFQDRDVYDSAKQAKMSGDNFKRAADLAGTANQARLIANEAATRAYDLGATDNQPDVQPLNGAAAYAYKRAADLSTNSRDAGKVAHDATNQAANFAPGYWPAETQLLKDAAAYATTKVASLPAPPAAAPHARHWYNPFTW